MLDFQPNARPIVIRWSSAELDVRRWCASIMTINADPVRAEGRSYPAGALFLAELDWERCGGAAFRCRATLRLLASPRGNWMYASSRFADVLPPAVSGAGGGPCQGST